MDNQAFINTFSYIDIRNNIEILNVGQVVEITGINNDVFVGKIEEIDLEANGIWISQETQIEDTVEWYFQNKAFFYEIDIKLLRVLS